ncbi:MAG: hypothetical protein PWQ31_1378 [Eubacteriales bacterium]|nr:hypothetical protein [Eubacteriales bacterium]
MVTAVDWLELAGLPLEEAMAFIKKAGDYQVEVILLRPDREIELVGSQRVVQVRPAGPRRLQVITAGDLYERGCKNGIQNY